MAKSTLSETTSETTAEAEASGDIIEGSPTSSLAVAPGAGITGDLDASDISFPRLQIVQGMGNLSENYKKGEIVLDGESLISDGPTPVEFTVCRIGKQFEENVDWDSARSLVSFQRMKRLKLVDPLSGVQMVRSLTGYQLLTL